MSDTCKSWRPGEIVVWEAIREHSEVARIISLFPNVPVRYARTQRPSDQSVIQSSGKTDQTLFLGHTSSFVKEFSGKPGGDIVCRKYFKLVPISRGCPYNCAYCYLDLVYRRRVPWIKMNLNHGLMFEQITQSLLRRSGPTSFNMGEMLDSLALDHVAGLAAELVPFFAQQPRGYLMLLTKSSNVEGLLGLEHRGHTVVSWSLNCSEVIERFEIGTASLGQRVEAARQCQDAGYPMRYRLDPVIIHEDWQSGYAQMIDLALSRTSPENITIGTLRFLPGHPTLARTLHGKAAEHLFAGKFVAGVGDRKRRYRPEVRLEIYRFLIERIHRHYANVPISLCRETPEIWQALSGEVTRSACNCVVTSSV